MDVKEAVHKVLPYILKPMSWLYGAGTGIRNWLFDHNVLAGEEFNVPVVSVGNITVGGTGKTPHVEYIVGLLSSSLHVAVLSRGYKRKTKGFVLANVNSTPETIGDEPLQIYNKYSARVKVAVCEDRRSGIKELLRQFPDTQLIVLDDAFQHRYVKPKVNILLMDYKRPIYDDNLLPLGRLRESGAQMDRADMVIVTKCPGNMAPLSYRLISKKLELMPYQKLYYSSYSYGSLLPVFPHDHPYSVSINDLTAKDSVLLLTGIANPRGFIRHFKQYPFKVVIAYYPDHHNFTREDIKKIKDKFLSLSGERKIIITTEKDAVRLSYNPYFPLAVKPFTFFLPVTVKMHDLPDGNDLIQDLQAAIKK